MTAIHVFGDAESMDLHFQGLRRGSARGYEFLVPDGWEIYGKPSDAVIEAMRQAAAAAGVPLTVHPELVAGFVRTPR